MAFEETFNEVSQQDETADAFKMDVKKLSSAVLARIVDEVKNDDASTSMAYDRSHNRHNR